MADALLDYSDSRLEKKFTFEGHITSVGFTYRDFLSWGNDIRCELINGIPYLMAGASVWHQRIVSRLNVQLASFLNGKPCEVFIAPFDVRLFPKEDKSDKTVVQPDVLVICDKKKINDGRACKGPPDFIVEVISENSEGKDLIDKKKLYEKAGIKEYWAVGEDKLYKYILVNGAFQETVYKMTAGLDVEISVLKGCTIVF